MFTRSTWLLIVAPLCCLGCSDAPVEPPDARQGKLVGMWREVYQGPKGIITLKADGTYTAMSVTAFEQRVLFKLPETIDIKGTWKTTEGTIHFHIDEASAMNDELAGKDVEETIKSVNDGWFTTTDAKGHEIMYTRTDSPVLDPTKAAMEAARMRPNAGGEAASEPAQGK
jgi:hypothetical protein